MRSQTDAPTKSLVSCSSKCYNSYVGLYLGIIYAYQPHKYKKNGHYHHVMSISMLSSLVLMSVPQKY